jgi:hypothetical protein
MPDEIVETLDAARLAAEKIVATCRQCAAP